MIEKTNMEKNPKTTGNLPEAHPRTLQSDGQKENTSTWLEFGHQGWEWGTFCIWNSQSWGPYVWLRPISIKQKNISSLNKMMNVYLLAQTPENSGLSQPGPPVTWLSSGAGGKQPCPFTHGVFSGETLRRFHGLYFHGLGHKVTQLNL